MTTQEIADKLVAHCRKGDFMGAAQALYSPDILSVEATPMPDGSREAKGIAAVAAKGEWWVANHDVHSVNLEAPLVAGSHFCVRMTIDVTFKPTGARSTLDELCIYHVADGKIVREEFFYGA